VVFGYRRAVRVLPDEGVVVRDGTRLSARVWLPDRTPAPAVLEATPYRKDDTTRERDDARHPRFARAGYVSVRLDLRGSGASEGVLRDEYDEREQADVDDTIAWLAGQPWCDGRVGMIGLSWGGFAALQAAARRPPALRAIVAVGATGDRYGGDVKYRNGGAVLASELVPWASTVFAETARPPSGGRRELWRRRLEELRSPAETWLAHPRRDAYWEVGHVEDVGSPALVASGWSDGYTDAVFDLGGETWGLIGPWAHAYPDEAAPGPPVDFTSICLRWWDAWLRGGTWEAPRLVAWLQDPLRPEDQDGVRRGRWVADAEVSAVELELPGGGRLDPDETVGTAGGAVVPWGAPDDWPRDQRPDDARSLLFETAPLDEPLDLLGFPRVGVAAESPLVAARLCHVWPDGTSTLLARAFAVGAAGELDLRLSALGCRIPAGHRLRVALSGRYWPWIWPPASRDPLVVRGPLRLELPVVARAGAVEPPELPPPESTKPSRRTVDGGRVRVDRSSGEDEHVDELTVEPDDPLSARVRCTRSFTIGDARIETESELTADAHRFRLRNVVRAYDAGVPIFESERIVPIARSE
jgi:predicted acyl esterase